MAGCAVPTKNVDYAAFKASKPRSIVVLPPLNESPDVKATYGMLSQVTTPLAEAGYYVLPVALVDETFRQNGLTTAADIHGVPVAKLKDIFGADAALYVTITQYGTKYMLIDSVTGNAPAWFAGDSKSQGAYAHNAVLSGIKTQALAGSQTGASGYNQLVFDDTDGQSRTQLSTTQAATALTLGHHKEQIDSARQADLGHGAMLATNDSGSVRAGAGLLLTAHAAGTGTALLDSEGAASQIEAISELAELLADVAQKQKAGLPDEPAAQDLPALKQLRHTTEVLRHAESTGEGATAIAYSEPHLQVSAPKGIAATTPADAVLVAGTQATLIARQDANLAAGGNLAMAVADGLTFFAHGKAVGQSSDAAAGIALHAASGKVGLSALKGASHLVAEKAVTVASTQGDVTAQAKSQVLVNAAGAQIRVTNGTIELHAPGKTIFKGAGHTFVGPGGGSMDNTLAHGNLKGCGIQEGNAATSGAGSVSR
ncbi:GNA1162 family protein [Ralstonia solanacearum]|nr:GNA1162 family protein [Ralstonia solanacearum]